MTFAGLPRTTVFGGILPLTTEPADTPSVPCCWSGTLRRSKRYFRVMIVQLGLMSTSSPMVSPARPAPTKHPLAIWTLRPITKRPLILILVKAETGQPRPQAVDEAMSTSDFPLTTARCFQK